MEESHVRLLAQEQAWIAIRQARDEDAAHTTAAVHAGIESFFAKYELTPEHWILLRLQLQERKENWGTARKSIIGIILAAALLFGGQSLWEKAAAKIIAADIRQQKAGSSPVPTAPKG